jgi:hypothetical protein
MADDGGDREFISDEIEKILDEAIYNGWGLKYE